MALSTIHRWLHKNNIPVQYDRGAHIPPSEAKNHCNLDFQVKNFLDGSLLGDGNLTSRSSLSARYQLGQKHKEYCAWVSDYLGRFGIEQSGKINKRREVQNYSYKTKDYGELKKIYDKWYPNGEKEVPKNIILTPFSIKHWFIEDGTSWFNNNGSLTIQLATNCFNYNSVKLLMSKLANILCVDEELIHIYEDKGYKISFGQPKVVDRFYAYIENLNKELSSIYGYKWKGDYSALATQGCP